jgi:transcriptional regulator with XRE-family HTH domain
MDSSGQPSFAPEILSPGEIRDLRRRCKLTQQQLARRLNVSRETIVRWERGKQVPNPVYVDLLRNIENEILKGTDRFSAGIRAAESSPLLEGRCPICGDGPLRSVPLQLARLTESHAMASDLLAYQCIRGHIFFVRAEDVRPTY